MEQTGNPSRNRPLSPAERALIEAGLYRLPGEMRRLLRFGGRDAAQQAEARELSRECDRSMARLVRRLADFRQSALHRSKAACSAAAGGDPGPEEKRLVEERDRNQFLGLSAFLSSRADSA